MRWQSVYLKYQPGCLPIERVDLPKLLLHIAALPLAEIRRALYGAGRITGTRLVDNIQNIELIEEYT